VPTPRNREEPIRFVGTHAAYDKIKNIEEIQVIKLIKNNKQLNGALERVKQLWDAKNDTPERDELEVLFSIHKG